MVNNLEVVTVLNKSVNVWRRETGKIGMVIKDFGLFVLCIISEVNDALKNLDSSTIYLFIARSGLVQDVFSGGQDKF